MMKGLQLLLLFCLLQKGMLVDITDIERQFIVSYNNDESRKPDIKMDEAWMTINNSMTSDILIYAHNHECWKCKMIYVDSTPAETTKTIVVNTTFGTDIIMKNTTGNIEEELCSFTKKFTQNGDYWMFFDQSQSSDVHLCALFIEDEPMAAEMPILYVAAGLFVLGIVIKIISIIHSKLNKKKKKYGLESSNKTVAPADTFVMSSEPSSADPIEGVTTHSKRQRLKSLDTFRGLSLVLMIFVNYGGGGYWFFDHLPWNGLTIADLVFPWFVFMMGTSMNYSFRSMFKRGKTRLAILAKIIIRSVLLFAFGLILNTNWGPIELEQYRIPGVLQRLSLSYLLIAVQEAMFARRRDIGQNKPWSWARDIILYIPEWIVSLGILAAFLALTFALPVPGCPTGYIGPGGLHDGKLYENCTGGAAGYIDRVVLGNSHIYGKPTPKAIYQTNVHFDPEGILGTLSSAFLCFLGLQAGRIFVTYKKHKGRIIRLIIWAIITGAIGAGLCKCSQNDGIIPLNKNLWSLSFILVTASFGYILLCVLYIFVDILKWWNGTPFIYPGMNPLVVYLCQDIFYRFFPVNWVLELVHWKLLLKAVWDVAIWITLAFVLYCKKIFIAL